MLTLITIKLYLGINISEEKNMYGPVAGLGASAVSVAALAVDHFNNNDANAAANAAATVGGNTLPSTGGNTLIDIALVVILVTGLVVAITGIARIMAAKANATR
ncbi:MAG: hypothetical protein ACR2FM_01375 [Candidatus Saccharimonadales bacterium]